MSISDRFSGSRYFYALIIIVISIFYVLLVLAVNSALIDLVVSEDPRKGLDELDQSSRIISSIALGLPVTLFLLKIFKIKNFGMNTYFGLGVAVFILLSGFIVNLQRDVVEHFVDQTGTKERSAAIGALIGIHALSNGALQMPSWGLSKIDKSSAENKTAAVYLIPFLALSGRGDAILSNAGALIEKSVYLNNKLKKTIIMERLADICSRAKSSHSEYYEQSNKIENLTAFKKLGERKYIEVRNNKLGYSGTLPIGLGYDSFIRHTDIQYHIRDRMADAVDEYSMSAQLQYILPKNELKTYLLGFFDRKFIEPCMNWDQYIKEYLIAIGDDLGTKTGELVVDQNWENVPNKDAIDEIGAQAVYAVIVPPSGIAWTLIAASLATALIGFRIATLLTGQALIGVCAAGGILFMAWTIPFTQSNQYLNNPNIQDGFTEIAASYGQPVASLLEWSIRAAPLIYPYGRYSRDHGAGRLFGLDVIN